MRQVHAVVFSKALYGSDGYSNVFLVPSAWLYHSTRFESIERYTLGVVPVFFSDFDKAMHYLSDYLRMQRVKNENYRDLAIVTCSLSPKGEIESILKMSEPKKVKYKKLDKQEKSRNFFAKFFKPTTDLRKLLQDSMDEAKLLEKRLQQGDIQAGQANSFQ